MKKEERTIMKSVNLPNTEARLAPLLYVFRIYQLIKSISGKNINYFNIFIIFPNFFSV